jgi:hypothetical protein
MQGNIVKLTIGGYFWQRPCIITGLSSEVNDDNATWEIGINDKGDFDPSVKELPHLIKVTSFNFIPIHTFVPKLQELTFDDGGITHYGNEKYIALSAGGNDNYTRDVPGLTPLEPRPTPLISTNLINVPLRTR